MPRGANANDYDYRNEGEKNTRLPRDVNKKFEVIVSHKLMLVNAEDSQ